MKAKRRKISPTSLVTIIKEKKWYSVHMFLNEARTLGANGTFALHEVCCDSEAPMGIVKDIYDAYPKAALAKDAFQETPLSVAVNAEFESAVHFLSNACPEASSIRDADGSTPIHLAMYTLNYNNMISSILNNNTEALFIVDNDGDSAFDCFFRHWNVFLRVCMHDTRVSNVLLDNFIGCGNWKVGDIYQHTILFLKAVSLYRRGKVPGDNHLLHCALQEKTCQSIFCKLILKMHPEQALRRDQSMKLPIHLITACRDVSDEESFLCFDCYTKKSKLFNIYFKDGASKYCCENCLHLEPRESISELVEIEPGT